MKLSGEITKCDLDDTQVAATEITILEDINIKELRNITEWWKNDNVLELLYYSDGFARVQRGDGLWNFIDKNGKIISEQWFEWVDNFKEGFARLQRSDGQYNFVDKEGKMKAVVSITIDDEFVVHDIKVIEGEKGLFIAMPSRKATDGEYRDIAHPINSATRDHIQTLILDKYKAELEAE